MLLNIFIILTVIVIFTFVVSYILKNPLLWVITFVLAGVMMISSFNIELMQYQYQVSTLSYAPVLQSYDYPMLATLFVIVLGLSLIYFFVDLFDIINNKNVAEVVKR